MAMPTLKRIDEKLPLYVYGRSLGGAVGVYGSTNPKFSPHIKGLILENTFTSIPSVANHIFSGFLAVFRPFLWILLRNHWNSLRLIPKIEAPILFIKSVNDELVPKS